MIQSRVKNLFLWMRCAAIITDLKEFQEVMQNQATDFMDVLLERAFLKLFKESISDFSDEEKEQLLTLKESFLENFRNIVGNTVENIVNHDNIQYLLNEIMETSNKVTDSPEYLEELCPIRVDFLSKLRHFKEEIETSNETLSKEREEQHLLLKEEVKATKVVKNHLIKVSINVSELYHNLMIISRNFVK